MAWLTDEPPPQIKPELSDCLSDALPLHNCGSHETMNTMMGKAVYDNQRDWSTLHPKLMAAYRSAVHQSTGHSQNLHILGREVNLLLDLILHFPPVEFTKSVS